MQNYNAKNWDENVFVLNVKGHYISICDYNPKDSGKSNDRKTDCKVDSKNSTDIEKEDENEKKYQRKSKCNERLRSNLKFVSTRFVLLETAKARVETPDGQKSKYLGILFDTGSQVCFITRRAKGLLHLVAKGSKKFSIK